MGKDIEKRQKAYDYIVNQAQKLKLADTSFSGYISLEEIMKLKEGAADPSETLIKQLKELFKHVGSEEDIYHYLIKPFENGKT
ncbi:hypothetical protein ACFLWN_01370 [Chloroflexota bacterium]